MVNPFEPFCGYKDLNLSQTSPAASWLVNAVLPPSDEHHPQPNLNPTKKPSRTCHGSGMGSGKRLVYQPRFSGSCFLLHVGIALLRVLIRCREQEKRGAVFGVKIYSDLTGSQVKSRIRNREVRLQHEREDRNPTEVHPVLVFSSARSSHIFERRAHISRNSPMISLTCRPDKASLPNDRKTFLLDVHQPSWRRHGNKIQIY
jgi:hypothetical protein